MDQSRRATKKEIEKFRAAAAKASEEVKGWPEWKKTGLELANGERSSQQMKETTEEPS